jgi:hypothetical protein
MYVSRELGSENEFLAKKVRIFLYQSKAETLIGYTDRDHPSGTFNFFIFSHNSIFRI